MEGLSIAGDRFLHLVKLWQIQILSLIVLLRTEPRSVHEGMSGFEYTYFRSLSLWTHWQMSQMVTEPSPEIRDIAHFSITSSRSGDISIKRHPLFLLTYCDTAAGDRPMYFATVLCEIPFFETRRETSSARTCGKYWRTISSHTTMSQKGLLMGNLRQQWQSAFLQMQLLFLSGRVPGGHL